MRVNKMNDQSELERQREHFDKIASRYYSGRQKRNHIRFKENMWVYYFKDKAFLKSKRRVLEAMCGYAEGKTILEKYLGSKMDYTGFDYSLELINKVKKYSPEIHVIHSDITRFEASNKFDLIILLGGLHHVPGHVQAAITNLHSVMERGGYFINFEPTHNNMIYKIIRDKIYKSNSLFDEQTEDAFKLDILNKYFIDNGFQMVDQIYPGLLSYILYYNPDAFPYLNIGGVKMVDAIFNIEKWAYSTRFAKLLSFATLTLWKKI